MRIFVKDYKLDELSSRINLFDKYLLDKIVWTDIFSNEGQYKINYNKTYKVINKDDVVTHHDNYYEDLNIITDTSQSIQEEAIQIPPDHLALQSLYFYYALQRASKIKLVIQFNNEKTHTFGSDTNQNTRPIDFYFETGENIDVNDRLIKEELSVFLSLLN